MPKNLDLRSEGNTQQNRWDYSQQNRDWEALENPQIDSLDTHFEMTAMTTYKSKYISKLVRPRFTDKYIHVKPLQWHFNGANIIYSNQLSATWLNCHLVAINPGGNYQGNCLYVAPSLNSATPSSFNGSNISLQS